MADPIDWKRKYEEQLAITDSLKRDLAAMQGHVIQPCPAAEKMGEHACKNQHQCWEPCGALGHDERHCRPISVEEQSRADAITQALGDRRGETRHRETSTDTSEPLMLPIRRPDLGRRGSRQDNGERRRKTD